MVDGDALSEWSRISADPATRSVNIFVAMNYPQPPHAPGYNPMGAQPPGPPFGGPPAHQGSGWEVGEVLSAALETFKISWGPLVGGMFLSAIISQIPSFAGNLVQGFGANSRDNDVSIIASLFVIAASFMGWAIGAFFQVGLTRMWCSAARREAVDFAELFRGANRFIFVLIAQVALAFIVSLGLLFFIVPGVILGLGLMFTQFFIVDAEMGPIEAMKASWDVTNGQKGKLFVYVLAMIGLSLAGLAACCIGIYVAVPICSVGLAIIYTRLSGRLGSSMQGGPPAPPAGFGPPPGAFGPPPGGGFGGGTPPAGGFGGYGPQGGGGVPGGGYGPPGGYGGSPQLSPGQPQGGQQGGYGQQQGGQPQGGGYGGQPQGGQPQGGGYGPPGGGGGYNPGGNQGGGGGY